jgi:hypothetical protein
MWSGIAVDAWEWDGKWNVDTNFFEKLMKNPKNSFLENLPSHSQDSNSILQLCLYHASQKVIEGSYFSCILVFIAPASFGDSCE